jgi:hypothetical protein
MLWLKRMHYLIYITQLNYIVMSRHPREGKKQQNSQKPFQILVARFSFYCARKKRGFRRLW